MGWPVSFEGTTFHSSPLLYDIDGDGREDIVVADGDGQIVFIDLDDDGQYVRDFVLNVPRLGIKHDWNEGLDEGGVDATMQLSAFSDDQAGGHDHGTANDPQADGKLHRFKDAKRAAPGRAGTRIFDESLASQRGVLSDGFGPLPGPSDGDVGGGRQGDNGAEPPAIRLLDGGYVLVDAHVLTTPVITDLDGDGAPELLVGVSYFFDPDTYSDEYKFDDGIEVDPSNYAATAIVCYDLAKQRWRWQVHLDLSTAGASQPSRMYASPTVADLEADGQREVVVATMAGNLYVLSPDGRMKKGFPVEVGPVQAQVLVEDLAGGAELEMLVADDEGGVTCFTPAGKQVWRRSLSAATPVAPTAGDVDGDGQLEVVVTSRDGGVWALDAATGLDIEHFPVRTGGRIMAPVTLVKLQLDVAAEKAKGEKGAITSNDGLQLLVPCFDGHVYVIAGATGCTNKIDIGEHVYAAVMVDDLSQDGMLELVVGTMNGNVLAFATSTPFNPLNSQPQYPMGGNSFAHRLDYHGVRFVDDSHLHRNIIGETVTMDFEIVDNRAPRDDRKARYTVSIVMGRRVLFTDVYSAPGRYSTSFALDRPQLVTLQVRMENEHGQVYWDVTTLTFNTSFYRMLKWMVVLPLALSAGLFIFMKPAEVTPLPSL